MKYFTKEELADITKELIENPTRETLKSLNEKYNGSSEMEKSLVQETVVTSVETPMIPPIPTVLVEESNVAPTLGIEPPVVASLPNLNIQSMELPKTVPTVVEEKPVVMPSVVEEINGTPALGVEPPVVAPLPNLNIQSMELPKAEPTVNKVEEPIQMPSFELPKLETPTFNNQNNAQVNFNGNLFDKPNMEVPNLMQTTDNFNAMPNTTPNTEVPVTPAPFFVTSPESVNNPIQVGGPVNNMPAQSPSMFGQFEQNYM